MTVIEFREAVIEAMSRRADRAEQEAYDVQCLADLARIYHDRVWRIVSRWLQENQT